MAINKIMAVILEKSEDGETPSVAKKDFEPALKKQCKEYKAFYYDEYMKDESCHFKIMPGKSLKDLQVDVYLMAEKFKPDIIFFNIVKDEINMKLLKELKKKSIIVNWFSDDDWRWENFSSVYCWEFNHIITTSSHAHQNYYNLGYYYSILCSWGSSKFIKKIEEEREYDCDVLFIGGWSKEREALIKYLKDNYVDVLCYGNGWERGPIGQVEMEHFIYRSKINLNLSNSTFTKKDRIMNILLGYIYRNYFLTKLCAKIYIWKNRNRKKDKYHKEFHNKFRYFKTRAAVKTSEQVKARHFEIPAFGGFQLSYSLPEIEKVFTPNKHIVLFKDKEDCLKKIEYYLEHDKEREAIALDGWTHAAVNYDYNKMFKNIIQEVQKK